MRNVIAAALLAILWAPFAHAVSCGTVAVPTTCAVTVGGVVKYTFSNFALLSASGLGGGHVYVAGDIAIDVATGGGNTGLITFSKLSGSPTPGVVFSANAGETAAFTFSYSVAIEPVGAPGVMYGSPFVVSLGSNNALNNGSGAVQFIPTPGVSCQAITTATTANCVVPGSKPVSLSSGNIVTLTGNAGNVSIGSFSNLFTVATAFGQGLDVDGNGSYSATTDGLLVIRYLLGLRGAALINGAVGANPTRSSSSTIEAYLSALTPP